MTPHAPTGAAVGRRRGPGGDAVLIGLVTTLIAHLLVIGGLTQLDLASPEDEAVRAAARAEADAAALAAATPLEPSCDGEAMLRAAARAAMCLTPVGAQTVDACLDQVGARLDTDFILCHLDTLEMLPPVTLVQVRNPEALPTIDAEKLLEPLTPVEQQQYEEQRQQQVAAAPPPPPPPLNTQVVEAAKPANEETPDDARFLSEYDSKVDEQKVARGAKAEDMVARPDPAEVAARKEAIAKANQTEPSEEDVGKNPEAPTNPGALSMRQPGAPAADETPQDRKDAGDVKGKDAPDGDGTARKRGDGSVSQDERKPTETAKGEGGGGGGKPKAPNLRPDDETLERIVGGGNVDHVEEVDEADETALNSKRWVYASFFNRLKRMVAQTWNPAVVWRREDPDGSRFGFKARNTQLRVSLNTRGEVEKVVVLVACGVEALDDEAIRAFKAAQPFPNPPQGLVDGNGLITFDFGFYFTIDSKRTSWKIQRSM